MSALRLSRRALLGTAGAFALYGCGARARPRARPRAVVVGAGLAGLTCAYRLVRAGFGVDVYEAASRVGGRAWTIRGVFAEEQTAERGGEFVDSNHTDLLALLEELGLDTIDLYASGPEVGPLTRVRGHRVEEAALQRAFDDAWQHIEPDVDAPERVDTISAAEWIETRIPGGRGSDLGAYLDLVWTGESGIDTQLLSAANLADALGAGGPGRFRPIGSSDEQFVIAGGSDLVPQRLAERVGHASIHTGVALEAVGRGADGRARLTLRMDQASRDVIADRVVLALPFTALRRCDLAGAGFSPAKLRAIRELGMGTNSKLHAQFSRRVWYDAGLDGDTVSSLLATTWEETWARPGGAGIVVDYLGGHAGATAPTGPVHGVAQAADAARFVSRLEALMPGVQGAFNGRAGVDRWVDDPHTHGSYSGYLVGQWTGIAGSEAPPSGNVHFAGEHTSPFQGFMNGAVESGNRVAREILAAG